MLSFLPLCYRHSWRVVLRGSEDKSTASTEHPLSLNVFPETRSALSGPCLGGIKPSP